MRNFDQTRSSRSLIVFAGVCLMGSLAFADAKFSLEGQLGAPTDRMDIDFNLSSSVSNSEPLVFRTYSHSGSSPGANHAGFVVPDGGFDPTLQLRDSGGAQVAFIDDGVPSVGNFDSLLSFGAGPPPRPNPVVAGDYTIHLEVLGNNFAGRTPDWALDLTGPDDVMALTLTEPIELVPGSEGISRLTVTGAGSKAFAPGALIVGLNATGEGTLVLENGGKA